MSKQTTLVWRRAVMFGAGLATLSTFPAQASSAGALAAPHSLQFRVHSTMWWSNGFHSGRTESTDYFDASPGDDIDGARAYPGWPTFRAGGPFRLGKIVDADHAWVHFSDGSGPVSRGDEAPGADSILVSTVDRSFASRSYDAGMAFDLRIAPNGEWSGTGAPSGMQLLRHGIVVPGPSGFRDQVESAVCIGVFHILTIRPGADSLQVVGRKIATTEIVAEPRELWKPGELKAGVAITIVEESPPLDEATWAPNPRAPRVRRGDEVVFFLVRGRTAPFEGRWTFSPHGGYRPPTSRGIDDIRSDVQLCERLRFHPGYGTLIGRVVQAGSGAPITHAPVGIQGTPIVTQSGPDGWFDLYDVPIGQRTLTVRDVFGETSASVEVTDERTDSLEARIAQPDDADPTPQPPEPLQAHAQDPESLRLPYDVAPSACQPVDPVYPEEARRSQFAGIINVQARVDSIGGVAEVHAQPGAMAPILSAAEACVRRWKFRPALRDGRPVGARAFLSVRFAHPTSANLAAPAARSARADVALPGGARASLLVEGSVELDSLTGVYRYTYRVVNRPESTRNLVAFALMPFDLLDQNFDRPEGWNGFLGCGERRDVVGWTVWGDAPRHDTMMDYAIAPGDELTALTITSKSPPGKVHWYADTTNPGESSAVLWDCTSSHMSALLQAPVQGTIVGPVPDAALPSERARNRQGSGDE